MQERWLEMRLSVPDSAVELVSQLLTELGSTGQIAAEVALDTFISPDPGALQNDPVLRAFFPYPQDPDELCRSVVSGLSQLVEILPDFSLPEVSWLELASEDWASNWQQHFPPFRVGRQLVICPSWTSWEAQSGEKVLTLDPGQAFGTGTHATTGLCLEALASAMAGPQPPQSVLDVGTGSGILAMATAALGVVQVVANDIDPEACRVARENVQQNQLAERVRITEQPLEEIAGQYDLVLANILAAENIRLGSALVAHLQPGGLLVLSGILVEQEPQVKEAFAAYPLLFVEALQRAEWSCLLYRREESR